MNVDDVFGVVCIDVAVGVVDVAYGGDGDDVGVVVYTVVGVVGVGVGDVRVMFSCCGVVRYVGVMCGG